MAKGSLRVRFSTTKRPGRTRDRTKILAKMCSKPLQCDFSALRQSYAELKTEALTVIL
jgi:hypothetical protein